MSLDRILAKLGEGKLTPSEIAELQRSMSLMETLASESRNILGSSGGLAADVFVGKEFVVLPHASAGLIKTSSQTITASDGVATITWDVPSPGAVGYWGLGIDVDSPTAPTGFSVKGKMGDSVYLVSFMIGWNANSTSAREVSIVGLGPTGASLMACPFSLPVPGISSLMYQTGAVQTVANADGESYSLRVTNIDPPANLVVNAGRFNITRLR